MSQQDTPYVANTNRFVLVDSDDKTQDEKIERAKNALKEVLHTTSVHAATTGATANTYLRTRAR